MPVVTAIEDRQRLYNIEIKKSRRREGPFSVIEPVYQSSQRESKGTRQRVNSSRCSPDKIRIEEEAHLPA